MNFRETRNKHIKNRKIILFDKVFLFGVFIQNTSSTKYILYIQKKVLVYIANISYRQTTLTYKYYRLFQLLNAKNIACTQYNS